MSSSNSSSGIASANTASTSTFVTALVFNIVVFSAELAVFTAVWSYFPAIYQPRSYVIAEEERSPPLADRLFKWPLTIYYADYRDIKHANGLDAYFFVRFCLMMVKILLPIWLISWVILLPITAVNTSVPNDSGLDKFVFGNIAPNKQGRYAAHLLCAYGFTFWICYIVKGEMKHFVETRQRWLIDPVNATAKSNTILITGVPRRYLTEAALFQLFSHLPGGVRKVWLNRDLKEMPDLHDRRVKACAKLESAETKLLATATKLHNKKLKKEAKALKKNSKKDKGGDPSIDADGRPLTALSTTDAERGEMSLAEKLVPRKKRPTHRLPILSFLPSLPLIGKEVDSIEWARDEIAETNAALRQSRRILAKEVASTSSLEPLSPESEPGEGGAFKDEKTTQTYPPLNSAFILFNTQIAAHLAAQTLTHHEPYRMADKSVGVAPEDVLWGNLNLNPYEARVRMAIGWGITIGLVIVWAIPVAFIGAVSNIHSLCSTYSWLAWICELPSVIVGILSGILPPALLAVLMMLLPIFLRLMARFEGVPQRTRVELSLMDRYFIFQVIHSFLIVTLSSGIITALPSLLNDPGSIPSLLAQSLPQASNFFLTYVILQGLTGTASGFLQIVPLAMYYVKLYVFASTPRSIYKVKFTLRSVSWGTLFPVTTVIAVITISYSIIAPIINGLSFVSFILFYYLWKYLFLWQLEQPATQETGGLFFSKSIHHIFVGLYLQQICLAALFFLARNENKKPSAVPEGALMIVLIAFTMFYHLIIANSYGPLKRSLPLTLADSALGMNDENRAAAEQELNDQASIKEQRSRSRRRASSMLPEKSGEDKSTIRSRDYATASSRPLSGVSRHTSTLSRPLSTLSRPVSTVMPVTASPAGSEEDLARGRSLQVPAERRGSGDVVNGKYTDAEEEEEDVNVANGDGDELEGVRGIDEEEGPKDFYHPATVDPQPVVWFPKDVLGLAAAEEEATRARGIAVTSEHAAMDEKAHVDIDGPPPDANKKML